MSVQRLNIDSCTCKPEDRIIDAGWMPSSYKEMLVVCNNCKKDVLDHLIIELEFVTNCHNENKKIVAFYSPYMPLGSTKPLTQRNKMTIANIVKKIKNFFIPILSSGTHTSSTCCQTKTEVAEVKEPSLETIEEIKKEVKLEKITKETVIPKKRKPYKRSSKTKKSKSINA